LQLNNGNHRHNRWAARALLSDSVRTGLAGRKRFEEDFVWEDVTEWYFRPLGAEWGIVASASRAMTLWCIARWRAREAAGLIPAISMTISSKPVRRARSDEPLLVAKVSLSPRVPGTFVKHSQTAPLL
jgi:hypothetical protein